MKTKHGGKRAGAGRPSSGRSKRITVLVSNRAFEKIKKAQEVYGLSAGEVVEYIITDFLD